jgi:hypothetical protein
MVLTLSDQILRSCSRLAQMRWEMAVRAQGFHRAQASSFVGGWGTNGIGASFLQRFTHALAALPKALSRAYAAGLVFPNFNVKSLVSRRVALTLAWTSVSGVALAATAITKGYIENPESSWVARIAERTQSPIYGRDNTLIGSVGAQQSNLRSSLCKASCQRHISKGC